MFEALRFYNKNIHCIIVVVVVGKYTSALTQLFVVGVFGTKDVNFTLACFWPCNFKTKHKHFRKHLCGLALKNKRHAMHAEAMTFHKGSLIIFRTFVKKLGYIKVTDNFCAE